MKFSFVADHFQYLACLGIIVLVVNGGLQLASRGYKPAAGTVFALLVGLLASLAAQRGLAFQNAETIWTDTLQKNDRAWIALDNLAAILQRRQQTNDALALLLRSRELKPANHVEVYLNLGSIYASTKQPAQARAAFEECMKQNGDPWFRANAAMGLGTLAAQADDFAGALKLFRQSVEIYPRLVLGYDGIAAVQLVMGHPAEALAAAEKALSINPQDKPGRQFLERAKEAVAAGTRPTPATQ
jgi:tetratricopeptide (TPR) repeat protein